MVWGVLASSGLGPLATDSPVTPVDSPVGWATLALVRSRRFGQAVTEEPSNLPQGPTWTSQTIEGLATAGDQGDQRALADTSTMQVSAPMTVNVADVAAASSAFVRVNPARQTKRDTKAPTVSVVAPANGATVSGTVTLSATASDNVGVAGVQFPVDNTALGAEDTAAPYSVSWDTTTATNGTHTLTARARDAAGNTTVSTVTVTVANDAQIPVTITAIDISWPADGHPLYPTAVAISGNNAYVYGGDVITVINTTTNTITDQTALYNEPPAITPDGRKYVPNPNLYYQGNAPYDSVDVIDVATGTVIKNIEIPICYDCAYANPSGPRDILISPDGQLVYVSEDYYLETGIATTVVTMIDTTTDSVGGYVPVAPLSDMEIAPDGTIYGASAEYPGVTVYNADMSQIGTVSLTSLGYYYWSPTTALALSGDKTHAYVVVQDYGAGQHVSVVDIDPASPTYNTEIAVITEGTTALSPDGSLQYVAQPDGMTVVVYDTARNTAIGSFTTDQNAGASPRSIAVAADGTLYITDTDDNKVYAVTLGDATAL
jgi:Big-like domain-containing protein